MQTSLEGDRGLHPDLRAIGAAFGGNLPRVLTIAEQRRSRDGRGVFFFAPWRLCVSPRS
jgi:hypothetical protein